MITKFEYLDEVSQKLVIMAISAREMAYCPYSNFKVGAALLDDKGNYHTGCNIESIDYTLTTHAEMLAIDNMVLSGNRKLKKIVVVTGSGIGFGMPCGLCRQKISEFADEATEIIAARIEADGVVNQVTSTTLKELYPFPFGVEARK